MKIESENLRCSLTMTMHVDKENVVQQMLLNKLQSVHLTMKCDVMDNTK